MSGLPRECVTCHRVKPEYSFGFADREKKYRRSECKSCNNRRYKRTLRDTLRSAAYEPHVTSDAYGPDDILGTL